MPVDHDLAEVYPEFFGAADWIERRAPAGFKIIFVSEESVNAASDRSQSAPNQIVIARTSMSPELFLVYTMWVLILFEPEWWLARFGAEPLKSLPTVLLPLLVCVAVSKAQRRALCWPMALFLVLHTVPLPFVTNRGLAMPLFKTVLLYYAVMVVSAATIDRVHKLLPIVWMFLLQFVWWGIHGLPEGRVSWHSLLANEDGYGPEMVIGVAFAGFFALGARSKGIRVLAGITVALCGFGIVASVARGAAMATAVVLVVVWLRSHRKLAMLGALLFAIGTIVIASFVFYPNGEFWSEMASIHDDIASIDDYDPYSGECVRAASKRACGSANDRWDLWGVGWLVFLRSPLVGVGPGNVGSYAAENLRPGEAKGFYADPDHIYGKVMHDIYVQILAEQGLIGVVIFLLILVDFMRRNRSLRTKAAIERWEKASHGRFDLQSISLGLEGAMVGFLASGVFYDQLYSNSLYSLVALNFVLSLVTQPGTVPKTDQAEPGGGTEPGVPAPEQPHRREWWLPKPY